MNYNTDHGNVSDCRVIHYSDHHLIRRLKVTDDLNNRHFVNFSNGNLYHGQFVRYPDHGLNCRLENGCPLKWMHVSTLFCFVHQDKTNFSKQNWFIHCS